MGFNITMSVRDNYEGSGAKRCVMFVLASYMNDHSGRCFPSVALIAKGARVSPRQASRLIAQLIKDGAIRVVGDRRGGKKGSTNTYEINHTLLMRSKRAVNIDSPLNDGDDNFDSLGMSELNSTPDNNDSQIINEKSKFKSQCHIYTNDQKNLEAIDPIPYQQILDLYNEILPKNPEVKALSTKRMQLINALWYGDGLIGISPLNSLARWREYFNIVDSTDFLKGCSPDYKGNTFYASFDWLIDENNFIKVIEGGLKQSLSY